MMKIETSKIFKSRNKLLDFLTEFIKIEKLPEIGEAVELLLNGKIVAQSKVKRIINTELGIFTKQRIYEHTAFIINFEDFSIKYYFTIGGGNNE